MISQSTTHSVLLTRLADGSDTAAWDEFLGRYGDLIRGFAARRGCQPADCDDLLQDVLIRLTRAMPNFRYDPRKGKFRSYLKTIVIHAIFSKSRQGRLPGQVGVEESLVAAESDVGIDDVWETEWRAYHMRQAMQIVRVEFNAADVQAFQHYALDGRGAEQVARELALSVDQVYQAKSRILKRLATLIGAQVAEEG